MRGPRLRCRAVGLCFRGSPALPCAFLWPLAGSAGFLLGGRLCSSSLQFAPLGDVINACFLGEFGTGHFRPGVVRLFLCPWRLCAVRAVRLRSAFGAFGGALSARVRRQTLSLARMRLSSACSIIFS